MNKTNKIILVALVGIFVSISAQAEIYTVEKVIDGSTLQLTDGQEVRLIGIEIPDDAKMGQEATEHMKDLIKEGQEVRLEFDVEREDKYGRLLAYVFRDSGIAPGSPVKIKHFAGTYWISTETEQYSIFINATMIGTGFASPMTISPNVKYADLYKKLHQEAKEQGRGLWRKDNEDVIDVLVHKLSKSPLWINGACPVIELEESAAYEDVIKECIKMTGFDKGYVKDYKIEKIKEVKIKGSYPEDYLGAVVDTDLGKKIILFRYAGSAAGWWTRVFGPEGVDEGMVVQKAEEYAEEKGYNLNNYHEPTVSLDSKNNQWYVDFEGKKLAPGNYFSVTVDAKSGEVKHLFLGE